MCALYSMVLYIQNYEWGSTIYVILQDYHYKEN